MPFGSRTKLSGYRSRKFGVSGGGLGVGQGYLLVVDLIKVEYYPEYEDIGNYQAVVALITQR